MVVQTKHHRLKLGLYEVLYRNSVNIFHDQAELKKMKFFLLSKTWCYDIARVLALYKSYWAAINKIFIYARPCVNNEEVGEVWRALKKLELLSAAPRATLTQFSCSPNFPRASRTRYTHAKYGQIVKFYTMNELQCFLVIPIPKN